MAKVPMLPKSEERWRQQVPAFVGAALIVALLIVVTTLLRTPTTMQINRAGEATSAPLFQQPTSMPRAPTAPPTTAYPTITPLAVGAGPQPQPAPVEQVAPPLATGTPEPAYVTETCLTPPGERPCWLPADQPWQPPASVPETPIVFVAPAWQGVPFVRDECADWHPPMPWPKGCEE